MIARSASLTLLCLLVAACASQPRIRYDSAPDADLAAAYTFSFLEPLGTDRDGYDTLLSQRLKAATRRDLELRGYRYVEEDPDLLVNFGASLDERLRVTSGPSTGVGYYWYRRGFYSGWVGYEDRVDSYREGTLNIDVVDAETMRMLWEGVAVGRVTDATIENAAQKIDDAVRDILRGFPPSRGRADDQRAGGGP
ncbi:MAG: DUF4136 domain-containing protein [Pseudomonadales bacterium]|jgi:hypothetical protein|nr:DUF4136 domain-containing protein [Pseudomonadales bacterium]